MDNWLCLCARITSLDALRYSPSGLPILIMNLTHESWQEEDEGRYLASFDIQAKLIGQAAIDWQHKTGCTIRVEGFLSAFNRKYRRPVLHIQTIHEI